MGALHPIPTNSNAMPSLIEGNIQDLHFEHNVWSNELKFADDELRFFEGRLSALVQKNQDKEMLARLEQFQNQFIREKEVHDQLLRDIHVHEQAFSQKLKTEAKIEEAFFQEHQRLRDQMTIFRKIFAELKGNFFQFLTKWK